MKYLKYIFLVCLACGCQFKEPAVTKASIPINKDLCGVWKNVQVDEDQKITTNLYIYKFNDNEYLIHFDEPDQKDGLYFRAFLFQVGKQKLMQLEIIGGPKRDAKEIGSDEVYLIAKVKVEKDKLEIVMIDDRFIEKKRKKGVSLLKTIENNMDAKELFKPMTNSKASYVRQKK